MFLCASNWMVLSYGIQECVNICVKECRFAYDLCQDVNGIYDYNTTLWIIRCANDVWYFMSSVLKIVQVAKRFLHVFFSLNQVNFLSFLLSVSVCVIGIRMKCVLKGILYAILLLWKLKLSMQNDNNSGTYTHTHNNSYDHTSYIKICGKYSFLYIFFPLHS